MPALDYGAPQTVPACTDIPRTCALELIDASVAVSRYGNVDQTWPVLRIVALHAGARADCCSTQHALATVQCALQQGEKITGMMYHREQACPCMRGTTFWARRSHANTYQRLYCFFVNASIHSFDLSLFCAPLILQCKLLAADALAKSFAEHVKVSASPSD